MRVHNRFGGMRDLAIFRGDTWDVGILITSGSGISVLFLWGTRCENRKGKIVGYGNLVLS